MALPPDDVHALLALLGHDVRLLGDLPDDPSGDLDVVVAGMDHRWPLRTRDGWRLVQYRGHDINSWMWILDRDGEVLAIDAVDDPDGLARYALPTREAFAGPGPHVAPGAWAAYLVAKRSKQDRDEQEVWKHVTALAAQDPSGFLQVLSRMVGSGVAGQVAEVVERGEVPDADLRARTFAAIRRGRVRTPARAARVLALGTSRWIERLRRPTGLFVALVGPDGAGKSAIVANLPEQLQWLFLRMDRHHWRPMLLPRPGDLKARASGGDAAGEVTDPHGLDPHPPALSHALLAYYWLDNLLGYWVRYRPSLVRSGLVLLERGWDDMAVDPRRYRLAVDPGLVTRLGRLLPKPELTVVLDGDPQVLHDRKPELAVGEVARQRQAWRDRTGDDATAARIDVTQPLDDVVRDVRGAMVDTLERRAVARLPHGWVALPTRRNPRVLVPAAPRRAAVAGLGLYRPQVRAARTAVAAARVAARLGLLRLARPGPAPDRWVRERIADHVPAGGTIATLRSNHPGRFLVMVFDRAGAPMVVAKTASTPDGEAALAREAEGLRHAAQHLHAPLRAPALVDHQPGLLVTEAVRAGRPPSRPAVLPPAVARALGEAWAEAGGNERRGPVHGDFAPWNLLPVAEGWVLVDWEHHQGGAPPFTDVLSWFTQSHVLTGDPDRDDLLQGVRDLSGWVGAAVRAWAAGAGIRPELAHAHWGAQLDRDDARWDVTSPTGRAALAARDALRREIA